MNAHVRERLSPYLDGEVDSAERSRITAHLEQCPACTRLLEELALVDSALAALPLPETTGDDVFAARVRARIEAEGTRSPQATAPRPSVRHGLPTWTWAAAAALLLAVGTPLMLRELRPSGDGPTLDAVAPVEAPARAGGASRAEAQAASPVAPASAGADERTRRDRQGAGTRDRGLARAMPPAPAPAPETGAVKVVGGEIEELSDGEAAATGEHRVAGAVERGVVGGVAGSAPAAAPELAPAGRTAAATSTGRPGDKGVTLKKELAFGGLAAQRPTTAEGWRQLREAWREQARSQTDPASADEAFVRAVEAAAEAYRASADAEDERVLERDVAEYLAREHAPQGERVRRALRGAVR